MGGGEGGGANEGGGCGEVEEGITEGNIILKCLLVARRGLVTDTPVRVLQTTCVYTCEYNVKGANVVKLCLQAYIEGSDRRDESILYLPCMCSRVHARTHVSTMKYRKYCKIPPLPKLEVLLNFRVGQ